MLLTRVPAEKIIIKGRNWGSSGGSFLEVHNKGTSLYVLLTNLAKPPAEGDEMVVDGPALPFAFKASEEILGVRKTPSGASTFIVAFDIATIRRSSDILQVHDERGPAKFKCYVSTTRAKMADFRDQWEKMCAYLEAQTMSNYAEVESVHVA